MLPTPFTFTTEKRQNRSLIQDVTPFLNNIISQYTNPLPFETEPHILHTIPLVREHCDSYFYCIRYKTLEITPSQTPFQVIFNPVKGINSGTFYRTINPKNTIPQVQIFTQFLLKFLRFNYQLFWEQKDQQAYVKFPQILTHIELLPYIIKNENKHLHYRDLTSFNVTHFEQINLDHNFVLEHSATSDNRPFITSDTSHETTPEEQTSSVEPSYTRQQSEQSE